MGREFDAEPPDTGSRGSLHVVLAALDEALARAWDGVAAAFANVRVHRGSILDVECDAVVSPANSFGFMDGGIDALYLDHFGRKVQDALRRAILTRHSGELLVGCAEVVATDDQMIPYLIAAPTMRVPMALPRETVNPYLAARAVLRLISEGTLHDGPGAGRPVADQIRTVAIPGLGTGVGRVGPMTCAHQVAAALKWSVTRPSLPQSWAEASEAHQFLYTDKPTRLQY